MGKISDLQIREWIRSGERFEGKGDGDGLYLRFRQADAVPNWLFRYCFAGKVCTMNLGSYRILSTAEARKLVRALRAKVSLGFDVGGEKKVRKADALAKIEADKSVISMGHWRTNTLPPRSWAGGNIPTSCAPGSRTTSSPTLARSPTQTSNRCTSMPCSKPSWREECRGISGGGQ